MAFLLSRPQHGHMWNITFIFCHIFTITFTVISPEIQRQPTWPHGNLQPTLLKQPTQQPNISSDTVTHRWLVRSHPYSPVNLKNVWTRSRCTYLILFFFPLKLTPLVLFRPRLRYPRCELNQYWLMNISLLVSGLQWEHLWPVEVREEWMVVIN